MVCMKKFEWESVILQCSGYDGRSYQKLGYLGIFFTFHFALPELPKPTLWLRGPLRWFLFRKFYFSNFYMVSSCSIWSPIFKTGFVFDVRPFLLLSGKFLGFNGNFNGKMTKINEMAKNHFSEVQNGSQNVYMGFLGGVCVLESGLRILIQAPKVPFSKPSK